jgi:hypothetical protein
MSEIFTMRNKIVNALPPIDGVNGAVTATDIISMKNYAHCTFIMQFGVCHTDSVGDTNLIVKKGEDLVTCTTAFAAKYRTQSGDTLGDLTALPATGLAIGAAQTWDYGTGGVAIVVEVDSADLAPTIANPYDTVCLTFDFSNHAALISVVAVLSQGRYQDAAQPTAIA